MYKVTTEGTIRVPFIGSIKVVGLTAAQVRDSIGRQLAERRLGSASSVQVGVMRARK
jgi:protein involved in polysaccharide export with SLBB domain